MDNNNCNWKAGVYILVFMFIFMNIYIYLLIKLNTFCENVNGMIDLF